MKQWRFGEDEPLGIFRWIYRTLFARRDVFVLELPPEAGGEVAGNIRLTIYDSTPEDIRSAYESVDAWVSHGWRVVSAPPRPKEEFQ